MWSVLRVDIKSFLCLNSLTLIFWLVHNMLTGLDSDPCHLYLQISTNYLCWHLMPSSSLRSVWYQDSSEKGGEYLKIITIYIGPESFWVDYYASEDWYLFTENISGPKDQLLLEKSIIPHGFLDIPYSFFWKKVVGGLFIIHAWSLKDCCHLVLSGAC